MEVIPSESGPWILTQDGGSGQDVHYLIEVLF